MPDPQKSGLKHYSGYTPWSFVVGHNIFQPGDQSVWYQWKSENNPMSRFSLSLCSLYRTLQIQTENTRYRKNFASSWWNIHQIQQPYAQSRHLSTAPSSKFYHLTTVYLDVIMSTISGVFQIQAQEGDYDMLEKKSHGCYICDNSTEISE